MKDEDGEIVKSSYEMPKLALLPDLQSWMHFTFSANWKPKDSESYMRIDFPEQHLTIKGSYSHLKNPEVYIGIGLQVEFLRHSDTSWEFPRDQF